MLNIRLINERKVSAIETQKVSDAGISERKANVIKAKEAESVSIPEKTEYALVHEAVKTQAQKEEEALDRVVRALRA